MKQQLEEIRQTATQAIDRCTELKELDAARVQYLGKKGQLTSILKQMGKLSTEERPVIGQLANEVRQAIDQKLTEKTAQLKEKILNEKLAAETIDVTMPGENMPIGHVHPLTAVLNELKDIFLGMGFQIAEGPEVETDYYNFEALNIPKDHPARDTQDTFYINENILLRTQTSPVQIRVMENTKPPIRVIAPGRVYRSDAVDATHSPLFHQIEGLVGLQSACTAKTPGSACARTTSRSRNRAARSTFPVSNAAARAARCARARAGSRSSAAAWCTRRC